MDSQVGPFCPSGKGRKGQYAWEGTMRTVTFSGPFGAVGHPASSCASWNALGWCVRQEDDHVRRQAPGSAALGMDHGAC